MTQVKICAGDAQGVREIFNLVDKLQIRQGANDRNMNPNLRTHSEGRFAAVSFVTVSVPAADLMAYFHQSGKAGVEVCKSGIVSLIAPSLR